MCFIRNVIIYVRVAKFSKKYHQLNKKYIVYNLEINVIFGLIYNIVRIV